jgi:pimeloyl-ACP methyl ester carboxylesterase
MNRPIAAAAALALLLTATIALAQADPLFGTLAPDAAETETLAMNSAQAAEGAVGIEIPADPDEGFTVTDHEGHRIPESMLMDPPRDQAHPARNRQLVIPSGPVRPELGRFAEMNALFLLASGEGPKPTMLLLHGLPGNERNLDLAQAVRRAGWNVLTFTYRGAWGSEGTFSIQHAVEDSQGALGFLRLPQTAMNYDVDPGRIVVAGHSMGGYMAAHVGALDAACPRGTAASAAAAPAAPIAVTGSRIARHCSSFPPLAGVILLDAWDIAATARQVKAAGDKGRGALVANFDDVGHSLGPITAEDLADNIIRRGEEWDLQRLAPQLARLPVLSIYAKHGIAAENKALAAALEASPGARVQAIEMDTDHSFADHRIALAAEMVRWLESIAAR